MLITREGQQSLLWEIAATSCIQCVTVFFMRLVFNSMSITRVMLQRNSTSATECATKANVIICAETALMKALSSRNARTKVKSHAS